MSADGLPQSPRGVTDDEFQHAERVGWHVAAQRVDELLAREVGHPFEQTLLLGGRRRQDGDRGGATDGVDEVALGPGRPRDLPTQVHGRHTLRRLVDADDYGFPLHSYPSSARVVPSLKHRGANLERPA